MFFILSKILDFSISPIVWIILGFSIAVFSKNERRKKRSLLFSFVALLFFSTPMVFSFFQYLAPSSKNFVVKKEKSHFYSGILLGGMISYDEGKNIIQFNSNVNRYTQTIDLYKKGIIKKIIISGGSGSINYPEKSEARLLKNYMIDMNAIPPKDIYIEPNSNNTHENALFTRKLLDSLHCTKKRHLLITSPTHYYRAQKCFSKQGIKTYIFSYQRKKTREKWLPKNTFLPQAEILFYWNEFLHEMVGIVSYKIMGYI